MKKRLRIVSLLLVIVFMLTAVMSVEAMADGGVAELDKPTGGKLAISEINGANADNTIYQYVEVVNVSNADVDLSEYYIYRWTISNASGNWDQLGLKYMLGESANPNHDLARVPLSEYIAKGDVVLEAGEVALIWLNTSGLPVHADHGGATGTDQNGDGRIDADDFKAKWNVGDVKIANVSFTETSYYGFHAAHFSNTSIHSYDKYNSGFIPLGPCETIIELTHKDAKFEGITNESGKQATPATDLYASEFRFAYNKNSVCGVGGNTSKDVKCYGEAARARHAAADCSALWFTEIDKSTKVPLAGDTNVHHYYGYFDADKYLRDAEELGTLAAYSEAYTGLVTGKRSADGKYTLNGGLDAYVDNGAVANGTLYFANDGDELAASAGTLELGQYGYGSLEMFGVQTRLDGNGTYSLRFVATVDGAVVEGARRIGFDVVAQYTDKDSGEPVSKSINRECNYVYESIMGKGTDGSKSYTREDIGNGHDYFLALTVENISIADFDTVLFTATPYSIDGAGDKHSFYPAQVSCLDGELSLPEGTQKLSKEEQIVNGFASAVLTTPAAHDISGLQPTGEYGGIKAVWFEGMEKNGSKTKVFAYVGIPEGASEDNKVPAVVLMHGGGGHAFLPWVKQWNERGYAAIAIDNTGYFPTAVNAGSSEECTNWSWGIPSYLTETGYVSAPNKDNMSTSAGEVSDMWMYHAVGQAILGSNLLRADKRIDADSIGISGVSWGGVITSITIGYDQRFAFAVPIYGSGYLDEAKSWMKDNFSSNATKSLWLAQDNFSKVDIPVLWLCWNDDNCFSVNSNSKSYLDTVKNNEDTRISMISMMYHSHTSAWARNEPFLFADSVVKGGAKLTELKSQPVGREISIALGAADEVTDITARLYYITEPMTYANYNKFGIGTSTYMVQNWQTQELSVSNGNTVYGEVPQNARAYYVEVTTTLNGVQYVTCSSYVELT